MDHQALHRPANRPKNNRRPHIERAGFALIELIIVIIAIALFAAFFWKVGFGGALDTTAVKQDQGALEQAKQVQLQVNARSAAEQQSYDAAQ